MDREEIRETMLAQTRGRYQENLILGWEYWSGAGLQGRARQYSARYAESRGNLLERIQERLAPLGYSAETKLVLSGDPKRWRRLLVVAAPDGTEFVY